MSNVSPIKKSNFQFPSRKILPEWEPQVLAWHAEHNHLGKVLALIKETYNITVDKSNLSRLIKRAVAERAEATQQVVRENIGNYILGDLEILRDLKAQLITVAETHRKKNETKLYLDTVDRLVKITAMTFELSGAREKQSTADADNAKESLINKLEKKVSAS